MYSRSTHVPNVSALETTTSRPMHNASIVPENQVTVLGPLHSFSDDGSTSGRIASLNESYLDSHSVLWIAGMFVQSIDKLSRLLRRHAFDVVHMRCDIEVHASARFVSCWVVSPLPLIRLNETCVAQAYAWT